MVTTMWARIENDVVVELTDIDPSGRFHPSLVWVACDDSVKVGMLMSEGGFVSPEPEGNHLSPAEQVDIARRIACADPLSGSDRLFVEAMRMQLMNEEGWEQIRDAGIARYMEIQAEYPWP